MAEIKSYPLKSTYFGNDRLILSDMEPDAQGNVLATTKNITLSTLKSSFEIGSLTLTTTGTSGASTFNSSTNTLNIPNYSFTDTNTTYDLNVPTSGIIRLLGSDGTTDDVSVSGTGGITVTQLASNNVNIDGSSISGGVSQVTAASPAASAGVPLVVTPTTGNVTVQSRAYAGGANVGHVPTGGSANHFIGGDGTWQTTKEVHQMSPMSMFDNNITNTNPFQGNVLLVQDVWTGGRYVPLSMGLFTPSNYATGNPGATGFAIYKGKLTDAANAAVISGSAKAERTAVGMHKITLADVGNGILTPGDSIVVAMYLQGDGGSLAIFAGTAGSSNTDIVALSASGATWPSSGTSFPTLQSILQLGSVTAPRVALVGAIYYE